MSCTRSPTTNAIQLAAFWQKLGFAAAIAAVALLMVFRLSRPGVRLGNVFPALMVPILAIWIVAGIALATAEPEERASLFFGNTWKVCPFLITMLATPVFAASFWAMRDLAPTNLRLAGAAAGLLSGAVGAVVYCFHCPELEAPFIAFWYLLGILIPTAVGGLPRGHRGARPDPDGGRSRRRGKAAPLVGMLAHAIPITGLPSRPSFGDILGYRTGNVGARRKKRVRSAHP